MWKLIPQKGTIYKKGVPICLSTKQSDVMRSSTRGFGKVQVITEVNTVQLVDYFMLLATNELPSQLQCGPVKLITELLAYDLDHFMDCGSQVAPIHLAALHCTLYI